MIALFAIGYASFYFLFFGKGWVKTTARNIAIFVAVGVVFVGAIVFLWWTAAPTTKDGRTFQYVIEITPNVSGPVTEVPIERLKQLQKGDVLFKIDPIPFQASVDNLTAAIKQAEAQKKLADIQVKRSAGLASRGAGAQQELDTWTARQSEAAAAIASLDAQLLNAQWQLEQTVVRAPADGYAVNLQLREGVRVTSMPMAAPVSFVSSEFYQVLASLSQSSSRRVKVGDAAEVVFASRPGQVYTGKVSAIVLATGQAQLTTSGQIPVLTGQPIQGRRPITIELDDKTAMLELGQGAQASVGVYTDFGKPFQLITKVAIRIWAWTGYLTNPAG